MKILITLLTFCFSMQAQDFLIMVGYDDFVETQLIAPSEMQLLKANLKRTENVNHSGVSRTFESEKGEIILEFYNEVGLKIESKEDLSNLQNVSFDRDDNNKIQYSTKLSESEFSEILSNMKPSETAKEFASFGQFYAIENKSAILFKGGKYFSGQYSIMSTLRGFDYELEHLLERPEKDDRFLRNSNLKEARDEKVFTIINGKQENIDLLVSELSELLNIDKEKIDFSVESINIIENSIQWNDGNHDNNYIMTLSYYYLAEALIKREDFEWEEVSDYFGKKFYDLRYKGNSTLLHAYLHDSFIESPLPQLEPAYFNTISEVKRL